VEIVDINRVEIFKTNVLEKEEAEKIVTQMMEKFPGYKINFDLSDCDKILRVEALSSRVNAIIQFLNILGYTCEILE